MQRITQNTTIGRSLRLFLLNLVVPSGTRLFKLFSLYPACRVHQYTRHAGYTIHFTKLLMLAITWNSKLLLQTFLGITGVLATAFLTVHNVPGMQGVPGMPGTPIHPACRAHNSFHKAFDASNHLEFKVNFAIFFWELQVFWLLPF